MAVQAPWVHEHRHHLLEESGGSGRRRPTGVGCNDSLAREGGGQEREKAREDYEDRMCARAHAL